jgi:hypothetical protein
MRVFPRRRRNRLALVGLLWAALLLAPGLLTMPVEARSQFPPRWKTHTDAELERVVDTVARRGGSEVWCWSTDDWSHRRDPWKGRADVWQGSWGAYTWDVHIHLSPNDCAVLKLLRTSNGAVWDFRHPESLAWSTFVLAHESWHFAGYPDERQATCWGLQRIAELAVALGRTPKEGRYLARLAWTDWYPRTRDSYRSRECRDGGRLDLSPKSHVWP